MQVSPAAPTPVHLIRSHSSAVTAISISDDNERLYTGDSSGLVVITSTRSLRAVASWNAHSDGLLGIEELDGELLTHARDNKIHVWKLPSQASSSVGGSAALPGLPTPVLSYSLDVNALNYCRFSLLKLKGSHCTTEQTALIAVPNLVESSLADIWVLPSKERLHAAIGKGALDVPIMPGTDGRGVKNATGIIMTLHLLPASARAAGEHAERRLRLLASYENGSVKMWQYHNVQKERSIEGLGWVCCWSVKLHVESVMATAVSRDGGLALSVSADHLVGRYDIHALDSDPDSVETSCTVHRTKHPGNSAVALHDDGRVCAVGDWDGKIRLYSSRTMKSLGTLVYHKDGVQSLAFMRRIPATPATIGDEAADSDSDDEMTETEKAARTRWLVSGGKDSRVAIWELMDFSKKG